MKYKKNDVWKANPLSKTQRSRSNEAILLTGKTETDEWKERYLGCNTIFTNKDGSQHLSTDWMIREDLLKKLYKFEGKLKHKIPYAIY